MQNKNTEHSRMTNLIDYKLKTLEQSSNTTYYYNQKTLEQSIINNIIDYKVITLEQSRKKKISDLITR